MILYGFVKMYVERLYMLLEVAFEGRSVGTKRAGIGPFARVGEKVALQVLATVAAVEAFGAHATHQPPALRTLTEPAQVNRAA